MITVILGTSPYPFNRAISWIVTLIQSQVINESVFLQSGVTDASAIAQHPLVQKKSLISASELTDLVKASRVVISHAGQGSARMLVAQGASFILLPRLARYREHVDDHQLSFAQATQQFGVNYCLDFEALKQAVLTPPQPLPNRKLFSGPKLADYLCRVYPGPASPISSTLSANDGDTLLLER